MTERIRHAGQVAWAVVGLVALVGIVGVVAWWFRVIWPPILLAGAIVFVLNPVVSALQRRRVPRAAGTGLAYLAFFAIVGATGLVAVPIASDQVDALDDELPEVQADIESWINELAEDTEGWPIGIPTVGEIEDEVQGSGESTIGEQLDQVRDIGARVFEVALIFLLAPIIAFYVLVDLPRLHEVAESLVPARSRHEVTVVARRLNHAIGGFFRGQLLVAMIVGILVSFGLAILDLPFWLIIGMVAGVFNIIPLIGPWVGAVPGIVIALTTRDVATAFWVAGIMAGAQQIDNHLISPLVMQRAVKLHPAAVMLALLAGGTLGGFLGLLMAVPATAVLKIVLGHVWRTYVLGEPFDELERRWEAADRAPAVGVVEDVAAADANRGGRGGEAGEAAEAGEAGGGGPADAVARQTAAGDAEPHAAPAGAAGDG